MYFLNFFFSCIRRTCIRASGTAYFLRCRAGRPGRALEPAAPVEAAKPIESPEEAIAEFGCAACHSLDSNDVLAGPGLVDVGARLSRDEMVESLIEPDKTLADGFPPMMGGALNGNGFYDRMTAENIAALVDYLVDMKGE